MHYSEAGNATAEGGYASTFQQEIEVMNRADGLYIRHHFKNLAANRLEIIWPENSVNRACFIESTESCSRLDENATAFMEGENQEQSISYMIPRTESMNKAYLFKDSFAKIHHSIASSTHFHLTDEIGIEGQWINGLKIIGREKMGLIDYSFYRGQGEVTDLYWQENEGSLLFNSDKLSVYGFNTSIEKEEYEAAEIVFKTLEIPHYTLMLNSGHGPIHSNRFIVKNVAEGEKVTNAILVNQIHKQFSIEATDDFTAEFIASLLIEKGVGSSRMNELYEEVANTLTVAEMKSFTEKVTKNHDELINSTYLDDVVEEVTGFQTSFFEKNDHVNNPIYPFIFEEPRTVYINGKENADIKILLKDGKTLYPGIQIMRNLGFEMDQNDRSLYLESATKKYRFPLAEPFYVFNERKYNVMSTPFERISNEFYFDEVSLIRIFLLDIKKSADKIDITPISIEVEENS